MGSIDKAQQIARKAIESTYKGRATVQEWQSVKDPVTHITNKVLVTVIENAPCKLSFETLTAAASNEFVNTIAQGVKLFIAPETEIKAGSKITVTQAGRTVAYACSGQPAVYETHQEIILTLYDSYA